MQKLCYLYFYNVQGDQLYMAVDFWYLKYKVTCTVYLCTVAYTEPVNKLQGTRITQPRLSGRVVCWFRRE